MNSLLHMRIHGNQLAIQLSVLLNHDLRIKSRRHENSIDTTTDWRSEDLADLQTDEEGVGNDDGREVAVGVVAWLGENEVEVGEQGASVADE